MSFPQVFDQASPFASAGFSNPKDVSNLTPDSNLTLPVSWLSRSTSLLFIDAGVSDQQTLIQGAAAGVEVHVLQPGQDAIAQITQTLLGRSGIDSLQIISHGESGGLRLGDRWLDAQTLPSQVNQLKSWGNALSATADILLYGCNVAQGATGQAFANLLAQATGADVAASDDLTGNATLGGNWNLEYRTGEIESESALSATAIANYQSTLAPVQFDLTPKFNQDVIYNTGDTANDDADTFLSGFVTNAWAVSQNPTNGNGLPNNGLFAANGFHPTVQLAYSDTNNGVNAWQAQGNANITFDLTEGKYTAVHLFATSTGAATNVAVRLNYKDGTTSTATLTVPDWFDQITDTADQYSLISGMDRMSTNNQTPAVSVLENANGASIFGFRLTPTAGKTLSSITLDKTGQGWLHMFGATGVANSAPTITGTPPTTIVKNTPYSFKPTVTDADGDTVTFSIQNKPTWATFSATTGELSGTPTATDIATPTNGIVISATDGVTNTPLAAFNLAVTNAPNSAPTGSLGITGTAVKNQVLTATNTIADADGLGTITYTWQQSTNGTTWVAIPNANLATLTLGADQVGQQVRAVASYTDGTGTLDTVNSAPTTAVSNGAIVVPPGTGGPIKPDALVRNAKTQEIAILYVDNVTQLEGTRSLTYGSGFGATAGQAVKLDNNWRVADTTDFNGDGIADVLLHNQMGDEVAMWTMGAGGQVEANQVLTGSDGKTLKTGNTNWKIVGFADVNQDRVMDIVWSNQQSDEVAFWLMSSDGKTVASYDYLRDGGGKVLKTGNTSWDVAGIEDFDGDGKMDLLYRLKDLNQTAIVHLDGKTAMDYQYITANPDVSLEIRGIADANGDGKADIYWQTPDNTKVLIQGVTFQAGKWLADNFAPIATSSALQGIGDLDLNGTADLILRDLGNNSLLLNVVNPTTPRAAIDLQNGSQSFVFNSADWNVEEIADFGSGRMALI